MEGRIKRHHKRKSTNQSTNDQDHISKLPEQLLLYILSFLQMQDVVKTSLLSKSWANLWTNVYNIDLRRVEKPKMESMSYEREWELRKINNDRWVSSVDKTLMKCNADIDKFCFIGTCDSSAVIDKWIEHVLDRKVKIIKLTSSCTAPDRIFQSSSLTQMELVDIPLPYDMSACPVSLSLLNSLLLDSVPVFDEFLDKILLGCPVLECLVLINVYAIHEVKIMSPNLKRFKLCNIDNIGDEVYENGDLTIKAPWLQELEISGSNFISQCELVNVSSLKKVTLTFETHFDAMYQTDEENMEYNNVWVPMLNKVLRLVSYVEELIIGSEQIQALSLCKVLGTPSPRFKCKHVSFETCLWKYDLPGIACLLENAPRLETVFIKVMDDWQHEAPLYQTKILFQDGDPHLGMPNGQFRHLKNVKIDYWPDHTRRCRRPEFFDFELLKYIMRSAVVLDKLVLCSSECRCSSYKCPMPSCSRLSSKLIGIFLSLKKPSEWDINSGNNVLKFTFQNNASLLPTSSSP